MNHTAVQPTYQHPTTEAVHVWNQMLLFALDGDNPPDVVHVDRRQVTRCPLCRAAMPAGDNTCPHCGMELDL